MDSQKDPIISFEQVSFVYGDRLVLDSLDCEIERGSITGIIGPNGSGKTTMLRLMNRIIRPARGEIIIDQKPIRSYTLLELAREVAFMPQYLSVQFDFTVLEVVIFGRYPHIRRLEWESGNDLKIAREALREVGLEGFEERPYRELSSGERKLVMFAKALVQDTQVLLLDEPLSNLDMRYIEKIFAICDGLSKRGTTMLLSIHNLDIASRHCSKLILLGNGKIAREGKPSDVLVPEILDPVYGVTTRVSPDPFTGGSFVSVLGEK